MTTPQNKETTPSATQTTSAVTPEAAAELPTSVTGLDYPTPGDGEGGTGAITPLSES